MRKRYLTSLTNTKVEDYLKRNDVIFIPVGNVEVHGGFPTHYEYVKAAALTMSGCIEAGRSLLNVRVSLRFGSPN
jgi:creatinine amidohydrolase